MFKQKVSERRLWIQYIAVMLLVLVCLVSATIYTVASFSKVVQRDATLMCRNMVQKESESLDKLLQRSNSFLDATAQVVDFLLDRGASIAQVESLLVVESKLHERDLAFGSRGFFGVVRNTFVNGYGWVPGSGYVPTSRPWYKEALNAHGEVRLIPPFADYKTSKGAIFLSKQLSDGKGVLALSLDVDDLKRNIEQQHNVDVGQWMVIDKQGHVILHSESKELGALYMSQEMHGSDRDKLARAVFLNKNEPFETHFGNRDFLVFSTTIQSDWFYVVMSEKDVLFRESNMIIVESIVVAILLFAVLGFFCTMSFVNRMNAVRSSKAKTIFLANMSHEIRTPINGILGMVSILMKELRDEGAKEFLRNVQNAGQSLLSIVNDILDISKIESGKMTLVPTEYDLFTVLSDCFNINSPKASAKNLRFSLECDPDIPSSLWGDEVRIRQIINNLLSNAVKYTEVGEVLLSVSFDAIHAQKGMNIDDSVMLKITVKDSGIGIRSEDMNSIFGTFQRVDQKKNRSIEGSGLGLSLTKQLVDMCGGEIIVKSRYGEGSTFMVSIPQIVLNVEPIGDFASRYKSTSTASNSVSDILFAPEARILAVDDVDMNLKVFRGLVKDTKVLVDTAMNGAQCLDLVKTKHYDLIFLDHMMPVMDGIETFEKMKTLQDNPNKDTPVIMLTANAIVGAKESYLKYGFADYLSKPLREQELIRVMKWYLPKNLILTREDLQQSFKAQNGWSKPMGEAEKMESIKEKEKTMLEEMKSNAVEQPKSRMEFLGGFLNTKMGMEFCAEDEDFYAEMLQEYVNTAKLSEIESLFAAEDWKNYQIQVHALKSTSLTIGAEVLSGEAKSLEFACKESRFEFVKENHKRVMEFYKDVLSNIQKGLEIK